MHCISSLTQNTTSASFVPSGVPDICTGALLQQCPSRDFNFLTLPDADAIVLAFRLMEPEVQVPASFMSSSHLTRLGRSLWNIRAACPPAYRCTL